MYEELDAAGCDVTYWATGVWWGGPSSSEPGYYLAYYATGNTLNTAQPLAPIIEAHPSTVAPKTGSATLTAVATLYGQPLDFILSLSATVVLISEVNGSIQ